MRSGKAAGGGYVFLVCAGSGATAWWRRLYLGIRPATAFQARAGRVALARDRGNPARTNRRVAADERRTSRSRAPQRQCGRRRGFPRRRRKLADRPRGGSGKGGSVRGELGGGRS